MTWLKILLNQVEFPLAKEFNVLFGACFILRRDEHFHQGGLVTADKACAQYNPA
ncbi:MAG: hypothetical protein WCA15_09255 [Candidatus Acidiferrales bacterium]